VTQAHLREDACLKDPHLLLLLLLLVVVLLLVRFLLPEQVRA
jgi:hypothetical protein